MSLTSYRAAPPRIRALRRACRRERRVCNEARCPRQRTGCGQFSATAQALPGVDWRYLSCPCRLGRHALKPARGRLWPPPSTPAREIRHARVRPFAANGVEIRSTRPVLPPCLAAPVASAFRGQEDQLAPQSIGEAVSPALALELGAWSLKGAMYDTLASSRGRQTGRRPEGGHAFQLRHRQSRALRGSTGDARLP